MIEVISDSSIMYVHNPYWEVDPMVDWGLTFSSQWINRQKWGYIGATKASLLDDNDVICDSVLSLIE
jgi:hypothetical protein